MRSDKAPPSGDKADVELILCEFGDEEWLGNDFTTATPYSDDVWHFDTEAIEDHGAYVSIAQNLARLTGGAMDAAKFTDFVDIEGRIAWCEVEIDGQSDRINLTVNDDWVDPKFFVWFAAQLKKSGSGSVIGIHGLGQDCLIVCKPPNEIRKLNKELGLKFSVG